ncbi:MAG: MarR family transcriptional regulator [Halopseudomonas sp.]
MAASTKNSVDQSMAHPPENPATERPRPDDNILVLVHMLSNRISNAFFAELQSTLNLSVAEWRIILTLANRPNATAMEISTRWAMEKMTVSRAIRHLEELGWIQRHVKADDRRSYDLTLTAEGLKIYDQVLPVANNRYHEIVGELDKSELLQFQKTLIKLIGRTDDLL